MFASEDPQDEVNFWSESNIKTTAKIQALENQLQKLKAMVARNESYIQEYKLQDKVVPDFDQEEVKQQTANQYKYSSLFKKFSYVRYLHRQHVWHIEAILQRGGFPIKWPKLTHHFWWVFHNCFAHIAIGLIPCRVSFKLHDWSSHRLNMPWKKEKWRSFEKAPSHDETVSLAEKTGWSNVSPATID